MFQISGYILASGGQTSGSRGGVAVVVWPAGLGAPHQTMSHSWSTPKIACCEDAWYHIVVTWDSTVLILYINGSLSEIANADPRWSWSDGNDDFTIGVPNNIKTSFFGQFYIDEMIYSDDCMRGEEVQQLFASYTEGTRIKFCLLVICVQNTNQWILNTLKYVLLIQTIVLFFKMETLPPATQWVQLPLHWKFTGKWVQCSWSGEICRISL